jgi:hypothetical protein
VLGKKVIEPHLWLGSKCRKCESGRHQLVIVYFLIVKIYGQLVTLGAYSLLTRTLLLEK